MMESKYTLACHCEEDLKTVASAGFLRQGEYDNAYEDKLRYVQLSSGLIGVYESVLVEDREAIKESSKPKNGRSKFVFYGSTHHGWIDTPESMPDVNDSIKNKMESKNTPACPVEEDSKTPMILIEESSKQENDKSEFVSDGNTNHEWNDTSESMPDVKDSIKSYAGFFSALFVAIYFMSIHYVKAIWCYLMSGFLNVPHGPATTYLNRVYSKILGSKSCLYSVAIVFGALIMMSRIPGASASGQCVGNSGICLDLAQNGTKLFDKYNDCMNVRCLDLSEGQHELLQYFPNVQELYMDDMGNITIPCDVFKNLTNLYKIDFHGKNFLCNPLLGLSQVTVAVLRYTPPPPCFFTKVMANMCFPNDQAPTSVSTEIIPEFVTTIAGNMVNQEKDPVFGVGFVVGFVVGGVFVGVFVGVIVIVIAVVRCQSNKRQSCSKSHSPVPNGVSKKTSSV